MTRYFSLFISLGFLLSCEKAPEETIKVLAVVNGQTIQKDVSTSHFKETFIPLFRNRNDEVTKSLNDYEEKEGLPWVLNRVSVGLSAEAELDIQIAEVATEAKFELRFQKRQ